MPEESSADPSLSVNRDVFADEDDYRAFCEAIITVADVGLLVLDKHGEFVLLNPTVRKLLSSAFRDGHDGRAGQTGDLYQADGVTEVPQEMLPSTRAARGEEFNDYFLWMGRDPELRRALSISARLMRDKDGEPSGAVLVTRDVTEVTRAVRAREDFLATISHELRTPLTSLLGYLELAAEETAAGRTDAVQAHLTIAQRNGGRLLRLVDELLNAATLTSGLELVRKPVDLPGLVSRSVESMIPAAGHAGIDLSYLPEPVPVLRLDEDRMTEVLENLLTNAIKFTPRGGSVEVICTTEGPDAVLTVRDTGIGFPAGDGAAIFERFFRAPGVQQHAIPGVGLGLHIVKVIVEAHGGRISAGPNADGPGTAVVVRLPLARLGA
ncbi:ATP-binding protein [Marmoricola sp. RAF53]|uniref:ATP-binding protein n=1 Tax=Marmoricola sp. RAF53 TaxID=3233059 RepID=UPI003F995CD5